MGKRTKLSTDGPGPAKSPKLTKDERLQEAAEILGKIEKAEAERSMCLVDWNMKKEIAKDAKDVYVTAIETLGRLCRARSEKHPLFEPPKPKTAKIDAQRLLPFDGEQLAAASGPDAWKKHGLAAAAFKENHQDALEAAGIHTLGDLQAGMTKHGNFWARELKVGKFRVAIEDNFNRYITEIVSALETAAAKPGATTAATP